MVLFALLVFVRFFGFFGGSEGFLTCRLELASCLACLRVFLGIFWGYFVGLF